jgi:hypothetical protein
MELASIYAFVKKKKRGNCRDNAAFVKRGPYMYNTLVSPPQKVYTAL